MFRRLTFALLLLSVAGCGSSGKAGDTTTTGSPPVLGRPATAPDAAESLGFPGFATKNTTRVGGADAIADAAGVARAVYPGVDATGRPTAVALVDAGDWRTAISAAQLAAAPLRFPILMTQAGKVPPATADAIDALKPLGSDEAGKAQVVRIGTAAAPAGGLKTTEVKGSDAPALARAIDRVATAASGKPSAEVIVAPSDGPGFAMPAAGLSARSGAPVLWTGRDTLPPATREGITSRGKPKIYVIGPPAAVSDTVVAELRKLGTVKRVAGADPVRNAIAVARFADGTFGWNVADPGHGLVFASAERPGDAAAGALFSSTGTYGPLLLVQDAKVVPAPLGAYLLDIQPGYDKDPVRGVYNHGWLLGDEEAISVNVQARIDALLEIQPVDTTTP
jgi:hypothetical protein